MFHEARARLPLLRNKRTQTKSTANLLKTPIFGDTKVLCPVFPSVLGSVAYNLARGLAWLVPAFGWVVVGAGIRIGSKARDFWGWQQDFERNRNAVVMIRLARFGARKQPFYRIVVIEKDRARNGRSIEVVGTYNPRTNPATVNLKHDRIAYWTSVGAQYSDIVKKLVEKNPAAPPVAEVVAA